MMTDETIPLENTNKSVKAPLTLPKLPFVASDIFLVSIALIIAYSGVGPLTTWQFFWCIASVALGALFISIPFMLEFRASAKQKEAINQRALENQVKELTTALEQTHLLHQSTSQEAQEIHKRLFALESLTKSLEETLEKSRQAKDNESNEVRTTLDSLRGKIETLNEKNDFVNDSSFNSLVQMDAKLDILTSQIQLISKTIEQTEKRTDPRDANKERQTDLFRTTDLPSRTDTTESAEQSETGALKKTPLLSKAFSHASKTPPKVLDNMIKKGFNDPKK